MTVQVNGRDLMVDANTTLELLMELLHVGAGVHAETTVVDGKALARPQWTGMVLRDRAQVEFREDV